MLYLQSWQSCKLVEYVCHVYWLLKSEKWVSEEKIEIQKNIKFTKRKAAEFDIYKAKNSGP